MDGTQCHRCHPHGGLRRAGAGRAGVGMSGSRHRLRRHSGERCHSEVGEADLRQLGLGHPLFDTHLEVPNTVGSQGAPKAQASALSEHRQPGEVIFCQVFRHPHACSALCCVAPKLHMTGSRKRVGSSLGERARAFDRGLAPPCTIRSRPLERHSNATLFSVSVFTCMYAPSLPLARRAVKKPPREGQGRGKGRRVWF